LEALEADEQLFEPERQEDERELQEPDATEEDSDSSS
jgi:hypothetical protein